MDHCSSLQGAWANAAVNVMGFLQLIGSHGVINIDTSLHLGKH